MSITLMTYIPQQLVALKIKHIVQRQRQFHHSKIAGQMPAVAAHDTDNKPAYLSSKFLELGYR